MDGVSPADAARAALAVAAGGGPVAVATVVTAAGAVCRVIVEASGGVQGRIGAPAVHHAAVQAARSLLDAGGAGGSDPEPLVESVAVEGGEWLVYVEAHFPPEELVIVGAGHIAVPLAAAGVMLGFRVTVLDDREEFATEDRFAGGVRVLRTDFAADPFAGVTIGERSYLALVTRGHRWDFDCLQRLLRSGVRPRYIGMVGSRRRVRAAFHALLEAGVPRPELARIHAPIGVEVGAETPAEIAVSVAAELIAVRRGHAGNGISHREQVLDRFMKG
jgi:xanthine dehydrogenase accessory factor